jgi:NADH-quinone oxidoreductase subunit M
LKSIFSLTTVGSIFAGLTLILCAVYVTKMYAMSMFGKGNSEFLAEVKDLSLETKLGLGVLAALVFIFGVYPQPLLSLSVETVTHILRVLVN